MINILLPTDFSENAQAATDFVCQFFDREKFRLHLVHAVVAPRSTPGMMINITQKIMADAEEDLRKEKIRLEDKFQVLEEIVIQAKQGYLQDLVPMFCRLYNIDVIAMGTFGENDLSSKFLGSNTEQIVRRGFAPILAIPREYELSDSLRICIATAKDKIPQADGLRMVLASLSNNSRAKLSVLRVLLSDNEKAHKSLQLNGRQIQVNVEKADTAEDGINSHLENNDVDLLVVCHRHNSRLDYLFSRSTTKKLTGQIQVPMLILPD